MSLIKTPTKYANLKGKPDLVYDAICKTLSERQDQVDWAAFTYDDWQLFARMAENEGVAPLLHWHAKEGGFKDHWPAEVCKFLQASYYKTAAQNALLFQELERILAAFESACIPVIVLKGAALAQTIYPNPGLRPMGDIDLMVDPKHLGKSLQLLKKLDYALWKMTYHAMLVWGTQPALTVELHWCLHSHEKEANTPTVLFGSVPDTNLEQIQAHLLYLCAHLFYQHFGPQRKLLWGYDLYAMMVTQEIDWEALEALADRLGWGNALNSVIAWLYEIFEAGLIYERIGTVEKRTTDPYEIKTKAINNWTRQAYAILPLRQKVTWLRGLIFPSADYLRWLYNPQPEWLWPLYLPRRWYEIRQYTVLVLQFS